jgi:hypothetical protein
VKILVIGLSLIVSGCGFGETAAVGVAGAKTSAEQAAEAKKTVDQVKTQMDALGRADEARRRDAEQEAR